MKTTTLAIMVASLLATPLAFAQEEAAPADDGAMTAEEGGGFKAMMSDAWDYVRTDAYVGIQLGGASSDASTGGLANVLSQTFVPGNGFTALDIDDGGTAYRIFYGKRIQDHLSVEVGFADLGDIDVTVEANVDDVDAFYRALADNVPVAPAGLTFDAIGDWSFQDFGMEGDWAERLSLTARGGLFIWSTEVEYNVPAYGRYSHDDDGVDLHLGVGAQYRLNDQFEFRFEYEKYMSTTKIDVIGLGVAWHF